MKPHPLSCDFQWEDRAGPARFLSDDQVRQFDEQGYLVLENVFDLELIDELLAEFDPLEEATTDFLRDFSEDGTLFINRADEITFSLHPVLKSEKARQFTQHDFFKGLTRDLVAENVRLYWDQLVYKKPGNPQVFPWHQDNGYTFIEPQQYLTCWVPLTDADEDNGCPWVLPGLHKQGTLAHVTTDLGFDCVGDEAVEGVSAPIKKGGVVVFSSLTPHMTGSNLTDSIRKTYIVQFAPDGACVIEQRGDELIRHPCTDPHRQYMVTENG